jgi:hypothetical protein
LVILSLNVEAEIIGKMPKPKVSGKEIKRKIGLWDHRTKVSDS